MSYASAKRVIDIIAALVLIPLCLPLFAIVAALIRLDSPGGAFFIQERMGFRGQTFRMIKFRVDATPVMSQNETACTTRRCNDQK